MITNATVWSHEYVTEWKPGIGKVIFAHWNSKIVIPCILKDVRVRRATFPSTEKIDKKHGKITCSQNVLANESFAIPIASHVQRKNPSMKVGTIDGTAAVAKIRV
jgi:hypothetical protein